MKKRADDASIKGVAVKVLNQIPDKVCIPKKHTSKYFSHDGWSGTLITIQTGE